MEIIVVDQQDETCDACRKTCSKSDVDWMGRFTGARMDLSAEGITVCSALMWCSTVFSGSIESGAQGFDIHNVDWAGGNSGGGGGGVAVVASFGVGTRRIAVSWLCEPESAAWTFEVTHNGGTLCRQCRLAKSSVTVQRQQNSDVGVSDFSAAAAAADDDASSADQQQHLRPWKYAAWSGPRLWADQSSTVFSPFCGTLACGMLKAFCETKRTANAQKALLELSRNPGSRAVLSAAAAFMPGARAAVGSAMEVEIERTRLDVLGPCASGWTLAMLASVQGRRRSGPTLSILGCERIYGAYVCITAVSGTTEYVDVLSGSVAESVLSSALRRAEKKAKDAGLTHGPRDISFFACSPRLAALLNSEEPLSDLLRPSSGCVSQGVQGQGHPDAAAAAAAAGGLVDQSMRPVMSRCRAPIAYTSSSWQERIAVALLTPQELMAVSGRAVRSAAEADVSRICASTWSAMRHPRGSSPTAQYGLACKCAGCEARGSDETAPEDARRYAGKDSSVLGGSGPYASPGVSKLVDAAVEASVRQRAGDHRRAPEPQASERGNLDRRDLINAPGCEILEAAGWDPAALAMWLPPCLVSMASSTAHAKRPARLLFIDFLRKMQGVGDDKAKFSLAFAAFMLKRDNPGIGLLHASAPDGTFNLSSERAQVLAKSKYWMDAMAIYNGGKLQMARGCRFAVVNHVCPFSVAKPDASVEVCIEECANKSLVQRGLHNNGRGTATAFTNPAGCFRWLTRIDRDAFNSAVAAATATSMVDVAIKSTN